MRAIAIAGFLGLGTLLSGVQTASAGSLGHLHSACRAGDFTACSKYNAAVIARGAGATQMMTQGYDPFAIVPATVAERAPKAPAGAVGEAGAAKTGIAAAVDKASR